MDGVIEIPDFPYVDIQPIMKGMSSDEKYRVTLSDGRHCLLRISEGSQYQRKASEFHMMRQAFEHGISTSEPYAFGRYNDGRIFQLTAWLNGTDLETILPSVSSADCFNLGKQAACLLQKIHAVPTPATSEPWKERFRRKIAIRSKEAEDMLGMTGTLSRLCSYMMDNLSILDDCTQCFNHGDFNPGNLILLENGELAVIDFNSYNDGYGEPIFETTTILLDDSLDEQFKNGFSSCYLLVGKEKALLNYYKAYDLLARTCEAIDEKSRDILIKQMTALSTTLS